MASKTIACMDFGACTEAPFPCCQLCASADCPRPLSRCAYSAPLQRLSRTGLWISKLAILPAVRVQET